MRRKDREVTDFDKIKDILQNSHVIRMGIQTDDYPYVVPTNYGYEFDKDHNLTIYVHGAPVGQKRELIAKNGHVGFEIDSGHKLLLPDDPETDTPSFAYQSIIGKGNAELVDNLDEKLHDMQQIVIHEVGHEWGNIPQKSLEYVGVIKITVKDFTAKAHYADQK